MSPVLFIAFHVRTTGYLDYQASKPLLCIHVRQTYHDGTLCMCLPTKPELGQNESPQLSTVGSPQLTVGTRRQKDKRKQARKAKMDTSGFEPETFPMRRENYTPRPCTLGLLVCLFACFGRLFLGQRKTSTRAREGGLVVSLFLWIRISQ